MKANRLAQIAIAAGIALTASVPAFSATAPASSLDETTQAAVENAPGAKKSGELRHDGRKAGERRHHHGAHKHGGMLLRGIELTDEQKTKVKAVREAAAPQLRESMKEAFESRKALRELTFSGKFDEAQAQKLAQTGADAMARASVLKAKADSEVLALLTAEQRKELDERAERMKEKHQERKERRQNKADEAPASAQPAAESAAPAVVPAVPAK